MTRKEEAFVKIVWEFYKTHGRRSLPWRKTRNPYRILVSEVMLQQTQVERVSPKYQDFLRRFPTVRALSEASLGDVLRAWQGLGYNRRAKLLYECACIIAHNHKGTFPKTHAELMALPGIGHYTAGAVMAFAYNVPVPIIETNIRTVFIHHFFRDDIEVFDQMILQLTERLLDTHNPREWYWALMDYGAYLKKTIGNQNVRSRHYSKQTPFKNSDRQIRGAILRALTIHKESRHTLHVKLPFEPDRIDAQLERLEEEGMIVRKQAKYFLPG